MEKRCYANPHSLLIGVSGLVLLIISSTDSTSAMWGQKTSPVSETKKTQREFPSKISGKILSMNGTPLQDVNIFIPNYPSDAAAVSNKDGEYELGAEANKWLSVKFEKAGYITVIKMLKLDGAEKLRLPDLVMIPGTVRGSTVDFNKKTPIQDVRGSVYKLKNNFGHSVFLFEHGTEATLILPNATTQIVGSIKILETEYDLDFSPNDETVRLNIKLSVVEALNSGAESITFSKPVICYMAGFPAVPFGTKIDAVYVSKITGNLETTGRGTVVMILENKDGLVELDVDGSDNPADQIALDSLGITDEELKNLATWSLKGQRLWRVKVSNFMF